MTRSTVQPKEIVTTEIEFQPAATANDINVQMLRDFENVKQGDRKVASDIARSPEVVENAGYVAKHPALQAFLEKYPDARNEIVEQSWKFRDAGRRFEVEQPRGRRNSRATSHLG